MGNKRQGKMCHFTKEQILGLDPDFVFDENNVGELYDIMEEKMLDEGFVMYDNDIEFDQEIVVNGVHELRYSCMVIYGHRRKDKFYLTEASAQYKHIK